MRRKLHCRLPKVTRWPSSVSSTSVSSSRARASLVHSTNSVPTDTADSPRAAARTTSENAASARIADRGRVQRFGDQLRFAIGQRTALRHQGVMQVGIQVAAQLGQPLGVGHGRTTEAVPHSVG